SNDIFIFTNRPLHTISGGAIRTLVNNKCNLSERQIIDNLTNGFQRIDQLESELNGLLPLGHPLLAKFMWSQVLSQNLSRLSQNQFATKHYLEKQIKPAITEDLEVLLDYIKNKALNEEKSRLQNWIMAYQMDTQTLIESIILYAQINLLNNNDELDSMISYLCPSLFSETAQFHSPLSVKVLRINLANQAVGCVLVGMRKIEYVQDSLSALELSDDDYLTIEALDDIYATNLITFDRKMGLDLDACISQLLQKQLLAETLLKEICEKTKELLMNESNCVSISAPVTVESVGDIHGQFYDLIEIFRIGGYCPYTNYLFLGDYVDRGLFSVETISLLTCLKLRYPHRVQLVRGNHESRAVTQTYGFYTECVRKYGSTNVWHYFTDMFDYLTLSVVIDDRIFCVHGGLSPSIHSIDQIKILDRYREIPHEGPMADLVWSDPDPDKEEFSISPRGAGYTFGGLVVKKFLEINKMEHILRAHQLCMEGYQVLYDDRLSTVWSAPNYCYRCGNMASILEVGVDGQRFFNVFDAAPENERDGPTQQLSIEKKEKVHYFL
ncbi:4554_t:CDS:10, partial [Funneliformis mosseae]